MKRVISFSLYGTSPIYLNGALRNLKLIPVVYPGWTARFYVSQEISEALVDEIRFLGGEVVRKFRSGQIDGMFWRFLPAGEPEIDAMVVRDTDSRVTPREFAAVCEWIHSGKKLHILRDHPQHQVVMPGGMWGCRSNAIPDVSQLIDRWKLWGKRGLDQEFLRDCIYPRFRNDCFVHSEIYAYGDEDAKPFSVPRNGGEFIGCDYQADRDTLTDEQNQMHQEALSGAVLKRLPPSRSRSKLLLTAKQYFRNVRQMLTTGKNRTAAGCAGI